MAVNLFASDGVTHVRKMVLVVGPRRCRRCHGYITPREIAAYHDRHEDCWVLDHLNHQERVELVRAQEAPDTNPPTVDAIHLLLS